MTKDTHPGRHETWKRVRLGERCTLLSGGTPSKANAEFWSGRIPWVSPKDMKSLTLADAQDHISEAGLRSGSALAPAGAVFVVVRGMILSRDVPVALAEVPMAFNQDVKAIVPQEDLEPEFLLYALLASKQSLAQAIGRSAHGTRTLLSDDLESLVIPVPERDEQRAIVSALSAVRRAQTCAERSLGVLRELKRAAMAALFARGLRGASTAETVFGPLPSTWPTSPLGECCVVQSGVTKGRAVDPSEAVDVPYLRVANVQDGHLDLREIKTITLRGSEIAQYLLQEGDVLLTEGGDFDKLGRGFVWRGQVAVCVHQNHVFAVRANRDVLLPEFLAYLVQSPYGKSYFLTVAHKTTNLASINSTKLKALPVPLPTLDEQREIVEIMTMIDRKLEVQERKRRLLAELFDTLLSDLITGRRRVSDLALDTAVTVA